MVLALVLVSHVDVAAEGDRSAGAPTDAVKAATGNTNVDKSIADQKAGDGPPKHADPKLVEIIKHVRENELRYRNLETITRKTTQVTDAKDRNKWSSELFEDLTHTVQQNDLLYFLSEESQTDSMGNKTRLERLSAFDGDKTRSVDYGNSVNIHLGRHESPFLYPPHNWALNATADQFSTLGASGRDGSDTKESQGPAVSS